MSALDEIVTIANRLPTWVLMDVNKRIGDWLASGGNEDDSYIEQQLRYVRRFVKE